MVPEGLGALGNDVQSPTKCRFHELRPESALETTLRGSVLVLIQFDVCEEIRLDRLREIVGTRTLEQISFKHPAPGYVRYQRPPVVEPVEPLVLESGE